MKPGATLRDAGALRGYHTRGDNKGEVMAKNKGYGFGDKYVTRIEAIATGLERAKKETGPKLNKAINKFINAVEKDAKVNLARPHWLLQQSITRKVVDYNNGKIWAMAGFRFQSKNPRSPGNYGQYHEAGWAPDRKIIKVPHHFLRRAKQSHIDELRADVDAVLQYTSKILIDTIKSAEK